MCAIGQKTGTTFLFLPTSIFLFCLFVFWLVFFFLFVQIVPALKLYFYIFLKALSFLRGSSNPGDQGNYRLYGNHMTVHRPNVCLHHRYTNERFGVFCECSEVFLDPGNELGSMPPIHRIKPNWNWNAVNLHLKNLHWNIDWWREVCNFEKRHFSPYLPSEQMTTGMLTVEQKKKLYLREIVKK